LINYLIQICDSTETQDIKIKESIKLDTLKDMVENEIGRNKKILIFSFFGNKVVPLIKRELNGLKIGKCLTITGKTNLKKAEFRKKLFRENPNYRFLICSDTLGYGANLQCAQYVINFDLPWNPAKIAQRIARVYRRGQTQPVFVYNLVTENSIEDHILDKIGSKKALFQEMLGGKKVKKQLSISDLLAALKA
jgi:SNF2 family DNA or RNA helicase